MCYNFAMARAEVFTERQAEGQNLPYTVVKIDQIPPPYVEPLSYLFAVVPSTTLGNKVLELLAGFGLLGK